QVSRPATGLPSGRMISGTGPPLLLGPGLLDLLVQEAQVLLRVQERQAGQRAVAGPDVHAVADDGLGVLPAVVRGVPALLGAQLVLGHSSPQLLAGSTSSTSEAATMRMPGVSWRWPASRAFRRAAASRAMASGSLSGAGITSARSSALPRAFDFSSARSRWKEPTVAGCSPAAVICLMRSLRRYTSSREPSRLSHIFLTLPVMSASNLLCRA